MATTLYYSDITHPTYTIAGFVVKRLLVNTKDDGLSVFTTSSAASQPIGVTQTAGGTACIWVTEPLEAITISANISHNVWGSESSMNANFGPCCRVDEYDSSGTSVSTLIGTGAVGFADGVEYGTSRALHTWTGTTTSQSIDIGNRLAFRLMHGGIASPASGFTLTIGLGGTTNGADGDTFSTLTENIVEQVSYVPRHSAINHQNPGLLMRGIRRAWHRRPSGIFVPDLEGVFA